MGKQLKYTNLWLVFDLHVTGGQQFGVDPLGEAGEDVLPWRPDGKPQREGATDTENGVPDDVPKESVQEEKRQVHDVHDRQGERGLVCAKVVPEPLVATSLDLHAYHDPNGPSNGQGKEEVGLDQLATENKDPEQDRSNAGFSI